MYHTETAIQHLFDSTFNCSRCYYMHLWRYS